MTDLGVVGFVPPEGFGQGRACRECGSFHSDPTLHERQRVQERRRVLLEAVKAGERFVAEKDFQAAGVGATSHLVGAGRSLDEWRARSGKTLRFVAGDELDAATVGRLIAEGREVPVSVAPPAPAPEA